MTGLKFLAFATNNVTRLPLALADMPSLAKLKLDDNPIQFPPPEEYLPRDSSFAGPYDEITHVCTHVKRFLRQAATRQRQQLDMEADMRLEESDAGSWNCADTIYQSESNLDTPRPPRRTAGGRFPVRPSMSGIDMGDLTNKTDGLNILPAPPIPTKSRARDSIIMPSTMHRPGLAPLTTEGLTARSRSETVTSAGLRSKRLGFVPRKISGPGPGPSPGIILTPDTATLKPAHFRGASHSSGFGASSGGETSSGPVSPVDGQANRPFMVRTRLSSLPEDRRLSRTTNPTIKSARLIVYSLHQLNRPVDDVIRILQSGTPKRSVVERLHFNASTNLTELDRQLHALAPRAEEESENSALVRAILKRSRHCLRAYGQVVSELRLSVRKLTLRGDQMFLRALMMQIFSALIEVRNVCSIHEAALNTPPAKLRISTAASDRTVTPTQSRPLSSKRIRGAKILAGLRAKSPVLGPSSATIAVNVERSRANTMSSLRSATPRTSEFGPISMSRSDTAQSHPTDSDEERQFEIIYLTLQRAIELADQALPECRRTFFTHREGAARNMQATVARAWTLALSKCDSVINALELMKRRLAKLKLNDPALRNSRDFWQLCDNFVRVRARLSSITLLIVVLVLLFILVLISLFILVLGHLASQLHSAYHTFTDNSQSWYDLGSAVKNLGQQGVEISTIKVTLRPVQKAVKDVSNCIIQSPLYKAAMRATPMGVSGAAMPSAVPPPTPLSAALGPAAQATVPSTPSVMTPLALPGVGLGLGPGDYFMSPPPLSMVGPGGGGGGGRERADTMGSSRYGRR